MISEDESHKICLRLMYEDYEYDVIKNIIEIFSHPRSDLNAVFPQEAVENIRSLIKMAAEIEHLEVDI